MRQKIKDTVRVLLVTVLLLVATVPGLAAEVRRVPSKNLVEQGFLALTLDAEGAEDFRYIGMENQQHIYKGKIKPGAKIKLSMQATLAKQSSLPLTGRTCTARMEVIAKKDGEVIKKNSFKSDNKSNVFVNYTVPEGADTLEVNETFVLQNQSKEEKFNQKCTSKNKLILSTADDSAVAAKADSKTENGDKKTGDEKSDTETSKTDAGDKNEGGISRKSMMAGAVVAVAAIAGGGYFFMKKRKEDQAANEEIARKEKLRQQAIQRQQELQQQNLQRSQAERDQRSRMLEEKRMRVEEEARQQVQREEQQPGETGAFVTGAAGVMGGMQNDAAEKAQNNVPNAAPQFCINCGAPLKPGARFCENCGAKV